MLGYVENPRDEKWETSPGVINKTRAHALLAVRDAGAGRRGADGAARLLDASCCRTTRVESADEKLDRMVNIWNPYQCMVTFNMSRCASYFETGIGRGMGFRDSNQDLLGSCTWSRSARASGSSTSPSTQFADGCAYHQYQPLTKRGQQRHRLRVQRRPAVADRRRRRLHQGDRRLRDPRRAGAVRQRPGNTARRCSSTSRARSSHVLNNLRAARPAAHRPRRLERLPQPQLLLRDARTSRSRPPGTAAGGTAESVFIAGMFVRLRRPSTPTSPSGAGCADVAAARAAPSRRDDATAVLEHGWDGDWFLRAYDFFGNTVGSRRERRGQDLDRAAGLLRHGAASGVETAARPRRRSTR